jgi:N-acetyl-anhydromuramyl-L-alanine amidase AmpD
MVGDGIMAVTKPYRITFHWTVGYYEQKFDDYHYLVDDKGNIYPTKWRPEDNNNTSAGKYAAHTAGGNTGNIGIALMAMVGYKNDRNYKGAAPITPEQLEAACKKAAELCKDYGIKVTPDTVFTHYEFGKNNPKTSSAGKIDINYLPHQPALNADEVGSFIRSKVSWYLQKI